MKKFALQFASILVRVILIISILVGGPAYLYDAIREWLIFVPQTGWQITYHYLLAGWYVLFGIAYIVMVSLMVAGLRTDIPRRITPNQLADEIDFLVDLAEGRHPEVKCADGVDQAFDQKIQNSNVETIRQNCIKVVMQYPTNNQMAICNSEGIPKLKEYSRQLRQMAEHAGPLEA